MSPDSSSTALSSRTSGRGRYRRSVLDAGEVQRQGHDRWLVSYADFMTLLMAFFVVMYSISQVSEQKYRVLSQTFSEAFKSPDELETLVQEGAPQLSHTITPIDLDGTALEDRPGNDATEVPETFVRIEEQLEQSFQDLIDNELIEVTGDERWLQIELPSAVLFNSGGIELSEPAVEIVNELAEALKSFNNVVRVEGFTDNVPVTGGQFNSNWELSAARASEVVKLLVGAGVEPRRLAAVGYGEHQPVASNSTEEGRIRNRRIVLMVSTQDKLREDVHVETEVAPEDILEDTVAGYEYQNRAELPEGALVRGLENSALDEARAWLAARYPARSNDQPVQTEGSAEANPGSAVPSDVQTDVQTGVVPAIDSVRLENGAILFTNSTN